MGPQLERLLAEASAPIGPTSLSIRDLSGVPNDLATLLATRNGFLAFESALHLYPLTSGASHSISLGLWNSDELWRGLYGVMTDGLLFFAEDAFGGQFALGPNGVSTFDPETGEIAHMADSLESWAGRVLDDFEFLTGFPLAHSWQQIHGQLAAGERLVPKRPFVLGGEYTVENLYSLNAVESMRLRAELAAQIVHFPEGASVKFKIRD